MKNELALTLLAILLQSGSVFADGLPFKGDRYAGPVTVFRMTPEQVERIGQGRLFEEGTRNIQLTREQKAQLQDAAGFAPQIIEVWTAEEAKGTCSCELLNIGIRIGSDLVQVPHFFLGENYEDRGMFESQVQWSDGRYLVSGALSVVVVFVVAIAFVRSLRARPQWIYRGPSDLKAAA